MKQLVTSVLMVLVAAAPLHADDAARARERYTRGTKLYDLGHYVEAAKEYEAAYEAKDDPALLFNIAQAYRLGHSYSDAIRAYKSFLRRVPNSEQRVEVESRIKEMQELVDQQRLNEQRPPTGTMSPDPSRPAELQTPAPAPVKTAQAETPVYKKWWLWTIVGGVVVAGVAVGLGVGLTANRDSFNPSLGKLGPSALTVQF